MILEGWSKYSKPECIVEAKGKVTEKGLGTVYFGCFGLIPAVTEIVAVQGQQDFNMVVPFQAHFEQLLHSLILLVCFCIRHSISLHWRTLFQLLAVSFIYTVPYRELSIDIHKDGVY